MDWEIFKQKMKDMVDDELANQIAKGLIVGVRARKVSRSEARELCPILSSDNPSRIWTRTQQTAMSAEGTMEEAIDMYENALLPAALDALKDQRGQELPSGKTCNWPPSFMGGQWVSWCVNNLASIKKNLAEKVYNLNGYGLWEIGEISTGLFSPAGVDPETGIQKMRIAVLHDNKGDHYYPEKNWH